MAQTWSLTVPTQDKHGSGTSAPVFTAGAEPERLTDDQILVFTHFTAAQAHRKLEAVTAWKMLINGIRDRSLIPGQFNGNNIYSVVDIGNATENNRKTATDDFVIQTGRVGIGISETLTGTYAQGKGAVDCTNILEAYFKRLIEYVIESPQFKNDGPFYQHG